RRHDHRRARHRHRQAAVHGSDLFARFARRDVQSPRRVRSRSALESGQSRSRALVPRMARCPFGPSRCAERRKTAGRVTTLVSSPAEAIAERLRDAGAHDTRLRIAGAGTWLDAGRPVESSEQLSLAAHAGITEYTPGDLTLTARAGTTLREVHDAVAPHGQWLALDPFGADDGTIGATIATASAGPLATRFGTPRDLTLGLEFVSGRGAIVRGGGRVVKNVAGFDLTRLLTGSWGTLGVITEATVRLHARPETDVTLV